MGYWPSEPLWRHKEFLASRLARDRLQDVRAQKVRETNRLSIVAHEC